MSWRRASISFVAWLFAASAMTGAATTLQMAHALRAFGAEGRVGGIVGVSVLRVNAPLVAAMAACLAVVAGLHRAGPPDPAARRATREVSIIFAAVLPATLASAQIALLASAATAAVIGVAPSTFWIGLHDFTVLSEDIGHGLGLACVYSVMFALIAARVTPALIASRHRLAVKLIVTWIAAGVSMGIVNAVLEALAWTTSGRGVV